jgi:hypothetical protein
MPIPKRLKTRVTAAKAKASAGRKNPSAGPGNLAAREIPASIQKTVKGGLTPTPAPPQPVPIPYPNLRRK